jgi:polyhydroxyalkanoate synthesis regulator phasin
VPKKASSAERGASRGDAVRSAVAEAIEATAGQAGFTRERAQQLADELAHAASRFRETLEELRPAGSDELRALRERVDALEEKVAALERRPAPRRRAPAQTSAPKPSSS